MIGEHRAETMQLLTKIRVSRATASDRYCNVRVDVPWTWTWRDTYGTPRCTKLDETSTRKCDSVCSTKPKFQNRSISILRLPEFRGSVVCKEDICAFYRHPGVAADQQRYIVAHMHLGPEKQQSDMIHN